MLPRDRCELLAKADGGHRRGSFRLASLTHRSAWCVHRSAHCVTERVLTQPPVTGQVGNLSALTSQQTLDLRVLATGDISNLSALTSLQKLDLKSTQVTDDIGSLSALTSLQQLDL